MTSQEIWSGIWSRNFTSEENRADIERERKSVRWKKIRAEVLRRFGSFSGLKVVELGAGRGIYSLLMSLEGARVTLMDNNELALKRAREFFEYWDQSFEAVCVNAFGLPDSLLGRFNIAMSYGLAEHFRYPERLQIFESHLRSLSPGGLLIVSVPNKWFVPYRIGKFLLERLKKWELGLEIPFSRRELRTIAQKLRLRNWRIMGSGVVEDTLNFWLTQRVIHLPIFLRDALLSRGIVQGDGSVTPLKTRFHHFPCHPETVGDDYFGYALVLIGET